MTIQISKTSWHYRLVASMNSDYVANRGLCAYMRKVMFSIFWLVVFAVIIGALAWLMLGSPVVFWLGYFDVIEMTDHRRAMGIVSQGIWLLAGVAWVGHMIHERAKTRRRNNQDTKPSVFMEYIKAKKEKVCPNIEFV